MDRQRIRALVVDDYEALARAIARSIQARGFDAVIVTDATSAKSMLLKQSFQLLVCDLNIGRDGCGLEVLAFARRMSPGTLRVLMSGTEHPPAGAHRFVLKPLGGAELDALLEWVLHECVLQP